MLEMAAGQAMMRTLQVPPSTTTVAEAMTMMTIGRFCHLTMMDHDVLVGLISIGDVVKARTMEQENEAQLPSMHYVRRNGLSVPDDLGRFRKLFIAEMMGQNESAPHSRAALAGRQFAGQTLRAISFAAA